MTNTKRIMYTITGTALVLMFAFYILMNNTGKSVFMTLGTISMAVCYHFAVRLVIVNLMGSVKSANFNPFAKRFRIRSFELNFYRKLRIKKWKRLAPNYEKQDFTTRSFAEIARVTCRYETAHLLCAAASLVSLCFSVWFGRLAVFLVTGIIGAVIDIALVFIQRYNRARFLKADEISRTIIRFSKAQESDADELFAIYTSLKGSAGCTWDDSYPTLDLIQRNIAEKSLYKLTQDGVITASAYLGEFEEISRPECFDKELSRLGELSRVAVRRQYQRQGMALRLISNLILLAKTADYDGVALLVGTENQRAMALYEKAGFEKCGETYLYDTHWYCYQYKLKGR